MEPSSLPDAEDPSIEAGPEEAPTLNQEERSILLDLARGAVAHSVRCRRPLEVDPQRYPLALRLPRAVFVTLTRQGRLRGCIGTLKPVATLAQDTARNAFAAALRDPRFAPVTLAELDRIEVELSVLGTPQPIRFADETDLLRKIRPHRDGLILECSGRRGTFLPCVWQQLPEPQAFLDQLKHKAGLPLGPLSASACVWRYTALSIPGPAAS